MHFDNASIALCLDFRGLLMNIENLLLENDLIGCMQYSNYFLGSK